MPTQTDKTILLATDLQQSVLTAVEAGQGKPIAHTPYGHRPPGSGVFSLIGFTGQLPDPRTGHYHLGNGYRQYNPVLMRFNSPDSWSPFQFGAINAYTYCGGDPVNKIDPTGHIQITPANSLWAFQPQRRLPRIYTSTTMSNVPKRAWTIHERTEYVNAKGEHGRRVISEDGKITMTQINRTQQPAPLVQKSTPAQKIRPRKNATEADLKAITDQNRFIDTLENHRASEGSRHRHSHDDFVSKEYQRLGAEINTAWNKRETDIRNLGRHKFTYYQLVALKPDDIRKGLY